MRLLIRLSLPIAGLAMVLTLCASPSRAGVIANGGFETGDLTGWNVETQYASGTTGSAGFYVTSGTTTPLNGYSTVGPASGNYYAVSDQNAPSAIALYQTFSIPTAAASLTLSFDMFVNDQSGAGPQGTDLKPDTPSNQHATVDILKGTADPLSTNPGDVLRNLYSGVDAGLTPNSYTFYGPTGNDDLTSLIVPGQTYILRFAEVSNLGSLNMGVDNVEMNFTPVPEPSTFGMFAGLGAVLIGRGRFSGRRNRR